VRFLFVVAHETAGAARTRSSLRPLFLGVNEFAKLGRMMSREREDMFSCHHPRRRMIQYSEESVIDPRSRGVLDTRLRGYDGGVWRSIAMNVIARSSCDEAIQLFLAAPGLLRWRSQ
jgi:hypothetical protein